MRTNELIETPGTSYSSPSRKAKKQVNYAESDPEDATAGLQSEDHSDEHATSDGEMYNTNEPVRGSDLYLDTVRNQTNVSASLCKRLR